MSVIIQFEYSDKVKNMRPSIIRELLKQMSSSDLISFAGGNPAADAFPVEQIREISDTLLEEAPAAMLQYSITEGYPPLRNKARAYVNRQFEVAKETDELLVLSGSQQAMDFLSKLLCNEGDIIATEDPAFLGALNSFRANGAHLIGVEMQPDGVDLVALEAVLSGNKKPRLYYTIPNFQNPTGFTTSLEKRKAVYQLCKKHGVPILEDNPYGELRFTGEDLPPIKSFDEEGLVIYVASFSKIFAPGMRVAVAVAQPDIINRMTVAKQGNDVHTSVWGQRVIDRFFETQDFDAHIERLRGVYREKAGHMMDALDRELGQAASYVPVEGGMFLWLTLPSNVPMEAFVKRCLEKKLALVPGNAFYVDAEAPSQSVRVNFSTPTNAQIDEGTAIMGTVLKEMLAEAGC